MDVIVKCSEAFPDDYTSFDWLDALEEAFSNYAERVNDITLVIHVQRRDPRVMEILEDLIYDGTDHHLEVRFQFL